MDDSSATITAIATAVVNAATVPAADGLLDTAAPLHEQHQPSLSSSHQPPVSRFVSGCSSAAEESNSSVSESLHVESARTESTRGDNAAIDEETSQSSTLHSLMPLHNPLHNASSVTSVASHASAASTPPSSIDALCEQLAHAQMAVRQVLEAGLDPGSGLQMDASLRAHLQTQLANTEKNVADMQKLTGALSQRDSCRSEGGSQDVSMQPAPTSNRASASDAFPPKRNSLGDSQRSKSESSALVATSVPTVPPTTKSAAEEQWPGATRAPRHVTFQNNAAPKPPGAKEHFTETIEATKPGGGVRRGASDSRMLNDTSRKTSLTAQLRRIFLGSPRTRSPRSNSSRRGWLSSMDNLSRSADA
uniref:Uncharacterized protein n=1 Tax=Haptolina brevifila TaxID=156173 RepID=A0A6U7DBF2_9EUKA